LHTGPDNIYFLKYNQWPHANFTKYHWHGTLYCTPHFLLDLDLQFRICIIEKQLKKTQTTSLGHTGTSLVLRRLAIY
jgi:hypothetical protein